MINVTLADIAAAQAYLEDPRHKEGRYQPRQLMNEAFARHRTTSSAGLVEALEAAKAAIVEHDKWHGAQTTPDPEHGYIPADEYADSGLYERTAAALHQIDAYLAAHKATPNAG